LLAIFRTEYIIFELTPDFARRQAEDRFLREVRVDVYVVIVLVPELAVMLVKEDMKVGDEIAR
jgi:hypothetical protein